MRELINWLAAQFREGKFFVQVLNGKDISDPIVQAIDKKKYETLRPEDVAAPIVAAQLETTQAVKEIKFPEINIPEVDLSVLSAKISSLIRTVEDKNLVVNQGDVKVKIDTEKLVAAMKKVQSSIESLPKTEVIDYTMMLDEFMKIVEGMPGYSTELSHIQEILDTISKKEFKIPEELITKDNRLRVTASQAPIYFEHKVKNSSGQYIDPALESNQDPLGGYVQSGIDVDADPFYFGGIKEDGSWCIKRLSLTEYTTTYAFGTSDFTTNWGNRATLTFNLYSE